MDDPWDVKSVKKPGQYTSCMKLNGVPLLPPVLSKECRSEMQYYKLLAKEVEKRISILQPYVDDCDSNEDKTEASEIVDCIENYDEDEADQDTTHNMRKITDLEMESDAMNSTPHSNFCNYDSAVNVIETCPNENPNPTSQVLDVPERDYNCMKPIDFTDVDSKMTKYKLQKDAILEEILNLDYSINKDKSMESYFHDTLSQGCPPSISSKSFTGSLNNIHVQSDDSENIKTLVRQHSYTILTPSPQLLAHLEVQSLNLGVEMSCISMSESLTNLGSPGKKRRSWDLESAKAKWSNMAMELKQKNLSKPYPKRPLLRANTQSSASPSRAKCVAAARTKYSTLSLKQVTKTEIVPRNRPSSPPHSKPTSPVRVRNVSPVRDTLSTETIILESQLTTNTKDSKFNNSIKESSSPKIVYTKKGSQSLSKSAKDHKNVNQNHSSKSGTPKQGVPVTPNHQLISESDDPATKVRELYEKIQHQQQIQMSNLMEKQKREQLLLQQAFEEQNNLLFKQLKTICPKSPEKVKEAWGDKYEEADRGPVSLSQLISPRTLEHSPVASTLTDSNIYINHCNDVLKKSRNITDSMRYLVKSSNQNSKASSKINLEGSRTRTNSPTSPIRKNTPTSRRLNYDTSVSDKDYDQMLTDRTNDTLADLNVTFPSDTEDSHLNYQKGPEVTVIHKTVPMRSEDYTIKYVEQTGQKSMTSSSSKQSRKVVSCQPTPRQQAAATKIVALAKGFLVRRLMQTARVQATVQTIKDALLCALQLHQDREGIRGADVDLHRRLIQQITAACYSLHDTFITSSPRERCALLAADRSRRASLAARPPHKRHSDIMSQSHSGAFPPRQKRLSAPSAAPALMTQSSYETYSSEKGRARYLPSPRRRPWR